MGALLSASARESEPGNKQGENRNMLKLSTTQQELCSSRALYNLEQSPKRNLGCAILVAAIEDYQSLDEQVHASARRFLYPVTRAYREHYEWATGLAEGVNPEWLRSSLDRMKATWDRDRMERTLRAQLLRRLERERAKNHGARILPGNDGIGDLEQFTSVAARSLHTHEPYTRC
jgi:hypothetical protein